MITALYFIGAIIFIISVTAGIFSGSIMVFLTSVVSGVSSAVVLFALAKILENQENILYRLESQEELQRRVQRQEKKVCSKCNNTYESDYNSCPRCGNRE
jgi:uncharacterized paraquat-inducible protein A